jgi:hypothetical protein
VGWGNITDLQDGFGAKAWGEAWEHEFPFESSVDDGESEAGARNQSAVLCRIKIPRHAFSLFPF